MVVCGVVWWLLTRGWLVLKDAISVAFGGWSADGTLIRVRQAYLIRASHHMYFLGDSSAMSIID